MKTKHVWLQTQICGDDAKPLLVGSLHCIGAMGTKVLPSVKVKPNVDYSDHSTLEGAYLMTVSF